jgi:hypothetical protein
MIDCLDLDLDQVQAREQKLLDFFKQWADAENETIIDVREAASLLTDSRLGTLKGHFAFLTPKVSLSPGSPPLVNQLAAVEKNVKDFLDLTTGASGIVTDGLALPNIPAFDDIISFVDVLKNWHDVGRQLIQESRSARQCDTSLSSVGVAPLILPIPPVQDFTFAELDAFLDDDIRVVGLIAATRAPQPSEPAVRELLNNLRLIVEEGHVQPQSGTPDPKFDVPNLVLIDRKISDLVDALTALVGDRNLLDFSIP